MAELAAMPKYETYKDTDNLWLGEVPSHWNIKKFKYLASVQKGKLPRKLTSLSNGSLPPYLSMEYLRGGLASQFVGDRDAVIVDEGEVLLLWDGSNSGEFIRSRKGVISSTVASIKYKNIDNNFAWYASTVVEKILRSSTIGMGIPHVDGNGLKNSILALPPKSEQVAIANFLDKKTAQIDEAIAIKEKQIELLKERKQIIIQQAVTQGLNPNAPMKDSGVDWIGEIPEHWEISKVRYLGVTQNGISAGAEYFGSGFPFVSYGDVYKNRELPLTVSGLAKSSINDRKQYSILENDILFTRTSETAEEIGFASICMETIKDSTFAGFLIRVRPTNKLFKGFSKYYFNSAMMREYFVKQMNIVIRASLSQELLKNLPVLLPSLDEQELIFNYLEHETGKVEEAIGLQFKQIEKLKEYKTTLINSAVTGKIKVTAEM